MNKKQNITKREMREPELVHIMFWATVAIILGLLPLALIICRMCLDYDLSQIIDLIFLLLGTVSIIMGFSVRYLVNELEHMTDLYEKSSKCDKINRTVDEVKQLLLTMSQSVSSSTGTDKA